MKNTLILILATIAVFFGIYCLVAFILMESNPRNWGEIERFFYLVLCLLLSVLLFNAKIEIK
jgi:uncharacterized RDD family membrane protein YckC